MSTSPDAQAHQLIRHYSIKIHVGYQTNFLFWKGFNHLWSGQGFAIDAYHIVTCAHVVGRAKPNGFRFPNHPNLPTIDRVITFPNGDEYDGKDIAIIAFSKPHGLPIAPLAQTGPAVGMPIMFSNKNGTFRKGSVNFYGSSDNLWDALITSGILDPQAMPPKLERVIKELKPFRTTDLFSNLVVKNGDSGSPVFNMQGEIIGMAHATSRITYQSMMMPIEDIRHNVADLLGR